MTGNLLERLRDGCVCHKKRWSGDAHDDLGGTINEAATDALLGEAAEELAALTAKYEAERAAREADAADAARYRWLRKRAWRGSGAWYFDGPKDRSNETLNAAIDAAIEGAPRG